MDRADLDPDWRSTKKGKSLKEESNTVTGVTATANATVRFVRLARL